MSSLRTAVLLLGCLLASFPGAASQEVPKGILMLSPRPAPALRLADMDGEAFDLAEARGRWVFVHFWASWCVPCRKEMPAIQRMAEQLGQDGPAIVLVNTAEDEDTLFAFLAATAPDLPSLMDRDGRVTEAWEPRGLPATYLVDPEGRLRYQALGGRPWDEAVYLEFLKGLSRTERPGGANPGSPDSPDEPESRDGSHQGAKDALPRTGNAVNQRFPKARCSRRSLSLCLFVMCVVNRSFEDYRLRWRPSASRPAAAHSSCSTQLSQSGLVRQDRFAWWTIRA